MRKIKFHKAYTRDVSFIMQEIWSNAFLQGAKDVFDKKINFSPIQIFYMNDGAIEVWENKKLAPWYKKELLLRNRKNIKFFRKFSGQYKKILKDLKKYWTKGKTRSREELQNFIKLTFKANEYFLVFYYSNIDSRTPEKIRKEAYKMREQDVFCENSDRFIRKSLVGIYPGLRGLEATLLSSEIDNQPNIEELKKRQRNSVMLAGEKIQIIDFETFRENNKKYCFAEYKVKNSKIIKGKVAYPGLVRGKVGIIRRKDQITEMKSGEILISPMTTPDYVPAMKKAAAIVTDEGGITCHAAIVSREMRKPCVVGTKIATKVLRDGDLVEVDAGKGVVKLLRKKK